MQNQCAVGVQKQDLLACSSCEKLKADLISMRKQAAEYWQKWHDLRHVEMPKLEEKYAGKDLEHKSLIREIQTVCGVDSLPPAPEGTGVNERALAVIANALPQQEKEEVR